MRCRGVPAGVAALLLCVFGAGVANAQAFPPAGGGLNLISTQTANASASLQFTNLPTSYNTLFMNCAGLTESNNTGALLLQVGEGATPTWETGAHYTEADFFYGTTLGSNVATGSNSTTATELSTIGTFSTTISTSFKFTIDNISSSTLHKRVILQYFAYVDAVAGSFVANVGSYWNFDTNPVTALRVTVSAGNLATGTCTLYGMN